jgi:mRNA-degrading endonuclease YafQ of YafQ-DinJ toxin-antitoxin module
MFQFNLTPLFTRKYSKFVKRNPALEKRIDTVLDLLAQNPRDSKLGSHKVNARDGREAFSSEVTGDIRLVWRYNAREDNRLDLIDIGGHSGGKKVYR